jgi:hypothetical protein
MPCNFQENGIALLRVLFTKSVGAQQQTGGLEHGVQESQQRGAVHRDVEPGLAAH